MKAKRRVLLIFITAILFMNTLQVGAVNMYREKIVYPSWFDNWSILHEKLKVIPYYLDENVREIDLRDSEVDEARNWGFKTLDEYSENEKVTLYATERTLTIPKFLKETYLNLGWVESLITLHAPDGRTLGVAPYDKQTYLNLGWYERPVTTLYTLDGRKQVFYNEDVEAQCSVGWYKEKPVLLYTLDGRKEYFLPKDVEAQCAVGWYKSAPVTLYTLDGRSKAFPASEVGAQSKVGWYTKREIEKIRELEYIASSFSIGQKVWLYGYAYTPVGYVTDISGGTVYVKWSYFYDWDWYRVYKQQDILYAEAHCGITLGKTYGISADRIRAYK